MTHVRNSRSPLGSFGRTSLALLAALAAACGDDGGNVGPSPAIAVAVAPATLSVVQGQSGTVQVTLTRTGGYTGAVALAATGAPTGVTPTFAPASLTGSTLASTLTLGAAATTTPGTYTVTIAGAGSGVTSASQTVALTVTAAPQTLTVTRAGTGTGTVTSTPAGITCGTTCTSTFASGTAVTLTAAAATGSTFAGWTGACTGATTTCTVTMSAAQTVTATFNTATAATNTLTVATAGTGSGSVASAPAGITCPGTCSASFPATTSVTLTATAATGSTFGGWSGACTGTSATCTVSLASAQTVTATFSQNAATFPLAITKTGTGTGTVTSSPAGVDCGATCTASFTGGTSVTLTATAAANSFFGGWSGACSGTAATCTVAMSAAQSVNAVFTAAPAGSFTLAVAPTTVSVAPGGSGTATVTITRANGFTGAVNLAVTGAPNGLSVTPTPASATGGTATLAVAATAATAPGTYTLTVTGTGTGVTQQTATLGVTVTSTGGGTGNIKYTFCAPDLPIWVAYQSNGGAWTKLTAGANNTYGFDVATRGAIAYVMQTGTSYDLTVVYGTSAELASGGTSPCSVFPTGTKHLSGAVAGVGAANGAFVSLGSDFKFVLGATGTTFAFDSLPDGPLNLVASRFALDLSTGSFGAPDKIILRRGVNYANNTTIPTLDFNGAEAFAPATATLSIANLGADEATVGVSYFTGVFGLGAFTFGTGGATQTYAGIPTAQLQAGDLHSLFVSASPANDETSSRGLIQYFRTVSNRTATLGAALSTPTVTSLGGTPYVRLRAQLASQSTYGQMATVDFTQPDRSATITMTSGYAGGTPATWDLAIPDLSAASFDPTWAPRAGVRTTWDVSAFGGNFLQFITGLPTDGSTVQYAMKSGTLASALRGSPSRAPRTSESRIAAAAQRADHLGAVLARLRR